MDNNEQLFDKIEDYLRGKLSAEESQAFEQQIASDPELAEAVEMHRFEQVGMEFLLEENLRQKMQGWKEEGPPSGPSAKGDPPRWGLWMGLLTVAIVFGFFFFRNGREEPAPPERPVEERQSPPSTPTTDEPATPSGPVAEKPEPESGSKQPSVEPAPENELLAVADEFYEPPSNFTEAGLRGGSGKPEQAVVEEGIQAFSRKEYKKAIRLLQSVRPENGAEGYETARECLAHAYLKDGQFNKAANLFQAMVDEGYLASINDRAEWYLLLSLLPDDAAQRLRVNQLIDKMAGDPYHSYHEKAVELKARLNALRD